MHWPKHKYDLSAEQKRMYASEKLMNFRRISKILAQRSSYVLTLDDLASTSIAAEISEIGQYSELVYSAVPFEFLHEKASVLAQPGFPLEGYPIFQECTLIKSCVGELASLPAYVTYRRKSRQLVVAISGTQSALLAFHDLRALKHRHPSKKGKVHSGFWGLYKGVQKCLFEAIREGLSSYNAEELIITGHSMGGAVSYLLCLDLLRGAVDIRDSSIPTLPPNLRIKLVVFGAPRSGDHSLVEYWRHLAAEYKSIRGDDALEEYSLKAYNDGVPALPPTQLGYLHFDEQPFYLDKSRLFHVPPSESEFALFTIAPETISPASSQTRYVGIEFPRGGHNYYNNRDMERLIRRLTWLCDADPKKDGWEQRYQDIVKRRSKSWYVTGYTILQSSGLNDTYFYPQIAGVFYHLVHDQSQKTKVVANSNKCILRRMPLVRPFNHPARRRASANWRGV